MKKPIVLINNKSAEIKDNDSLSLKGGISANSVIISEAELSYLAGARSDLQAQIDGKGGAIDGTISAGTINEAISNIAFQISMAVGAENETGLNNVNALLTVSAGGLDELLTASNNNGSESINAGTENEAISNVSFVLAPQSAGSEAESMLTSSVIKANKFTTTATNTRNAGTVDWVNPTNAQGAFNDTLASFAVTAGVALTTGDATLKCTGMALTSSATPTDFTRTALNILIRHKWDLVITLPAVDTAITAIELHDSAGVFITALIIRGANNVDNNQPTLLTESYNISAFVNDAQLAAGIQIWCWGKSSLSLATSGNMSWDVDAVMLEATYTRNGIN